MKKFLIGALMTATVAGGFAATPAMAQNYGGYPAYDQRGYPQDYYDDGYRGDDSRRHHRRHYRDDRRCSGTTGAVIGGVLGALLGGEIGRGSYYNRRSGTGTIVGAGAGALLGREISRSECRNR